MSGKKYDEEKIRTDLLPVDAVLGVARVLTFGAKKYDDRNWEEGIKWSRVYAAALRHLLAFWGGEDSDPETGFPHVDHAATCLAFLQHYVRGARYEAFDDRPEVNSHEDENAVFEPTHILGCPCYKCAGLQAPHANMA